MWLELGEVDSWKRAIVREWIFGGVVVIETVVTNCLDAETRIRVVALARGDDAARDLEGYNLGCNEHGIDEGSMLSYASQES
jgi:hypothetical protein